MSAAEIINRFACDAGEEVIDALKAAGYAVVELPAQLDDDGINKAFPRASYWMDDQDITLHNVPKHMTPSEAREAAASLLAAAEASDA